MNLGNSYLTGPPPVSYLRWHPYGVAVPGRQVRTINWLMDILPSGHYRASGPAPVGTDFATEEPPGLRLGGETFGVTTLAAQVAGVMADMLGENPALSAQNLRERIVASTHAFTEIECLEKCGRGIVDARHALDSALTRREETEPNGTDAFADYAFASGDIDGRLTPWPSGDGSSCPTNSTCLSNPTWEHDTDTFMLELPPGQTLSVRPRVRNCKAPVVCRIQISRPGGTDDYPTGSDYPPESGLLPLVRTYTNSGASTVKVHIRLYSTGDVPLVPPDYSLVLSWRGPTPTNGWAG